MPFFFAIIQCRSLENSKINKNVLVDISTQGSSCEFNISHPIELKIQNKSSEQLVYGEIQYNIFEDLNYKMYGDNLSHTYKAKMDIKPFSTLSICVISPISNNFHTLSKEDMIKDGIKIQKKYKNADVGFNIYNSAYNYKIENQFFEVK